MFIVVLRFSANKAAAGQHMAAHKAWIKGGFDDSVFLMAGSLLPSSGGCILAHNTQRAALEARVRDDPFVAENVVSAEILEVVPARMDERLGFLA